MNLLMKITRYFLNSFAIMLFLFINFNICYLGYLMYEKINIIFTVVVICIGIIPFLYMNAFLIHALFVCFILIDKIRLKKIK